MKTLNEAFIEKIAGMFHSLMMKVHLILKSPDVKHLLVLPPSLHPTGPHTLCGTEATNPTSSLLSGRTHPLNRKLNS